MDVDIRPAAVAAVLLEDFLGRSRFEIGLCLFSCVAGSNLLIGLSSYIFLNVFPVNRRHLYCYFGSGSNS